MTDLVLAVAYLAVLYAVFWLYGWFDGRDTRRLEREAEARWRAFKFGSRTRVDVPHGWFRGAS